MNLNFNPTLQELAEYTPLESMLVKLAHDAGFDEDDISAIEKAILSTHAYFLQHEGSFDMEVEHRKLREEPKNIIKVDFSS